MYLSLHATGQNGSRKTKLLNHLSSGLAATLLGSLFLSLAAPCAQGDVLLSQNFDTDAVNYTNTPFFIQDQGANIGTRYFNLSNAAGIGLNAGVTGATGAYIAVQDADTTVDPIYSTTAPPTLTFDSVNIGIVGLELSIDLAGMPNAESVNYIRAQIDVTGAGDWINIFNFTGGPDNTAYKDGTHVLTGAFANFTFPVPTPYDGVLRLRVQSFNDTNSLNEASGFDNIVVSTAAPHFGSVISNPALHFSEPNTGAINYTRGTNPPGTELSFSTTGGTPQGVTDYAGDKQFQVNNAAASFRTELIDLRTSGAMTAGIDLRTYATTASGFETDDFLSAFVEISTDGLLFSRMMFFESHGDSDPNVKNALDLLEVDGLGIAGPLTHFSLNIPADVSVLRFGVEALNNSASEFFIFDNLTLLLAQFPGDADGSGTVDFTDLGILLNSYNQPGTFETGDFDGSGTVDFTDLGILLNNYNQSAPTLTSAAPVPEPSSMVLAGVGLCGILLARPRRRVEA